MGESAAADARDVVSGSCWNAWRLMLMMLSDFLIVSDWNMRQLMRTMHDGRPSWWNLWQLMLMMLVVLGSCRNVWRLMLMMLSDLGFLSGTCGS